MQFSGPSGTNGAQSSAAGGLEQRQERTRNGYGAVTLTDLEDQRRHADADDVGSDDEGDSDSEDGSEDGSGKSADTFEEQFRWLEEEVATLVADVHDLALFSKLNLTGFMKILKVFYFQLS